MMKRIESKRHPYEVEIAKFLTSEEMLKDPTNHCVPILDVLEVTEDPEHVILIMPFLRRFGSPKFDTIGETVDFFQQIFEAGIHPKYHFSISQQYRVYNSFINIVLRIGTSFKLLTLTY